MQYTATQLAAILGVQTSTITRAIKSSKLSATRDLRGAYVIDASEVARAYPDRVTVGDAGTIAARAKLQDDARDAQPDATAELRAKIDGLERLAEERMQTIDDLRRRLDSEADERRKLTALLTDQSQKTEPAALMLAPTTEAPPKGLRSWLHRLTG